MSLKHFHIAFVLFCLLFSWGFAAWCLLLPGQAPMLRTMGWISLIGGFVLLFYGVRFYSKIKDIIT
ncbi:MAG: hypothetical protein AAGA96_16500 [Verrucomicrobiota bacterium]